MSRQDFRWKPLKKHAGPPQVFLGPLGGEPSAARFSGGAHFALAGAPDFLHPWLSDSGSLTARIVARCQQFQVRVLGETRALPCVDERQLIGLPPGRHAWTREVLLLADGVPVVFAHSVLAPRDLIGAWHMAQAIGSRPLGAALFADPSICRGPLSAARLAPGHPLHRHACAALGESLPTLWARRSRFCRLDRPLLVTEVFLPGIEQLEWPPRSQPRLAAPTGG